MLVNKIQKHQILKLETENANESKRKQVKATNTNQSSIINNTPNPQQILLLLPTLLPRPPNRSKLNPILLSFPLPLPIRMRRCRRGRIRWWRVRIMHRGYSCIYIRIRRSVWVWWVGVIRVMWMRGWWVMWVCVSGWRGRHRSTRCATYN